MLHVYLYPYIRMYMIVCPHIKAYLYTFTYMYTDECVTNAMAVCK